MQKKDIVDYLEQLGLSDLESQLFVTLLSSGALSVKELADLVGIKRTRAYLYIDSLIEKGLVIKIIKGSRKQVILNHPEKTLRPLVDKKVESAKSVEAKFPTVLKTIIDETTMLHEDNSAEIQYYKGKNGIKIIYEEALKAKELRTQVNLSEIFFPEVDELFRHAFDANPDLKIYEMIADSPASRKQPPLHESRYFRKYVPANVKLSTADVLIYDGKVSIINVTNKIAGTVLQNADYYLNSKNTFDLLWKFLS